MNPLLLLLGNILPGILDRVLPGEDKETVFKKLQIQTELQKAVADQNVAQNEVNKVEAASANVFVAGWRPFAGWCSVFAVMLWPILSSLINWILILYKLPTIPPLDVSLYVTILTGMLGIGGLRTYEKYNEVDTKEVAALRSILPFGNKQGKNK